MWWTLWAVAVAGAGEPFEIAVTIDDLPWAGAVPPDGREAATKRLLDQLDQVGVQATGFVNCGKPDQQLLDLWTAAGHTLGNHTTSHHDIDKVTPEVWLDDARSCHRDLTARLGAAPTVFRYPYLRNGQTEVVRDQARTVLTGELGQTLARVTVDNHDWKLGFLYANARVANDTATTEAVAAAYTPHLQAAVAHYRTVSRDKLGRDVKHVLLLHANALAADHLATALTALRSDGATFITLDEALTDPVYAEPDGYVGHGGLSWLYHVKPGEQDYSWDDAAWTEIVTRFEPPEATTD